MNLYGKIVFSSGWSSDFDIWSLDCASGELSQLTHGDEWNDFPKWSPDGSRIAYISVGEDLIASLWVMSSNGTNKKRLTTKHYCQCPTWSPDGKSLLFTANIENPNEIEVCVVDADGTGNPRSIFKRDGKESDPSWSPDGKCIVFAAPESVVNGHGSRNTDIWEYSLQTKEFKRLVSHPARDYNPCYSPDGKTIAFVSHRDTKTDDKYFKLVEKIKASIKSGDISSINDSIRKILSLEQDSDIWLIDRDGKNPRALTDDKDIDVGIAWSPCGQYIIHTSAPRSKRASERLSLIEVSSGKKIQLSYNRTPLEGEINSTQLLNRTFFQRLVPDIIEKKLVDVAFWGEEKHPDWTK